MMRRRYSIAWAFLLAAFLAIEAAALADPRPGDTLSEHVRTLIRLWPILGVALAIFLAWLAWHWLAPRA